MKNNSNLCVVILLLSLFCNGIVFAANEDNICNRISSEQEVEAYFAKNSIEKLDLPAKNGISRYLKVGVADGHGSCVSKAVKLFESDKQLFEYGLECDYNGCGFGSDFRIVKFDDKIYFLAKSYDIGLFEKLDGWKEFSKKERDIIKFRNMVDAVYLSSPDGKAKQICNNDRDYRKAAQSEKILAGSNMCQKFLYPDIKSIVKAIRSDGKNTVKIRDIYAADLGKVADIDLNGDGSKERIAFAGSYSGAGCGCDKEGLVLLNKDNKPIDTTSGFARKFRDIAESSDCGDNMDIVESGGKYYLEKINRVGTRQIFPLSGDKAFTPVCSYVNNSPVNWRQQ